jgi:threonine/homoserine/homoserine lactone efflux protein
MQGAPVAPASLVATLGCTLGIVPHMLAASTGLAAILHWMRRVFATAFIGLGIKLVLTER